MMRTVLTCLWAGHDLPDYSANKYSAVDVLNLWRGVHHHITNGRLVVLADLTFGPMLTGPEMERVLHMLTPEERAAFPHTFEVRPFLGMGARHGGWSHVLEAFNPELFRSLKVGQGRVLWAGLDTVFVRNSDWLFDWDTSPVGLPADPYHLHGAPCNAVVVFGQEGAAIVWDEFLRALAEPVWPYPYFGRASEMVLLAALHQRHRWAKLEGDQMWRLVSYKAVVLPFGLPDAATVVYFHGSPKPREIPSDSQIGKMVLR